MMDLMEHIATVLACALVLLMERLSMWMLLILFSLSTKHEDGTITPGWQSEQLALILLDRVKKLNEKFPCEQNAKQVAALEAYLDACKERIDDRLSRNVMGDLKE